MAIRSLKTGAMSRSALAGNPIIMPGSYESIATVTGNGTSQSLTFSNIPQTYAHLEIRGIGQASYSSNDNGAIGVRLNGDTGSNYTRHFIRGSGSSVSAGGLTSTTFAEAGDGAYLNTGSTVGASVISVFDYTNTNKYTTIRGLSGMDNNGLGAITLGSGLWINTAAVTSLTIFQQNANFTDKSTFALYGIA